MSRRKPLYLFAAFLTLILGASSEALACSCANSASPCEEFGTSRAVFVGKVIGAKEQREHKKEDGTPTTYQVGEIYFKVEQSFLGVKTPQVVIHSGTGGGDCGYWFIKGERYLVYAYGESMDQLSTNICTRTEMLKNAEEDLSFLRTMPRKGSGVRIHGTVAAALKDPKSADWRTAKPLSGITVKVVGKQAIDAVTNAEGQYELTGLAPGKYKVYAEVPDYYYRGDYWVREFELADRGCKQADFFAHSDSWITGRVLKADGSVIPRATVEIMPADAEPGSIRRMSLERDYANEKGEYELKQIPPGRYIVGVNLTSSPDKEMPVPRTFYPGTTDQAKAIVIELGLGEKVADIEIRLPANLVEYLVRGFVIWPDGSLAGGVDVHLEDTNYPGWCVNGCEDKTDAQGQFELRGYSGYNYRVVSTADKLGKREQAYGVSSPFILAAETDGLKIVLSKPGRPWDKDQEPEVKSPK